MPSSIRVKIKRDWPSQMEGKDERACETREREGERVCDARERGGLTRRQVDQA